jgi:hypothetical protein
MNEMATFGWFFVVSAWAALGRKPPPNRHLKGRSKMSVYPTNFRTEPFHHL